MKRHYKTDEWRVIEEGFNPYLQEAAESIFSLGNGRMGQRANFEERYTGETLQGNYIAGVYYPDKTRVGWWKNGYPEYFAKVPNAPNWIGISVMIGKEELDLHQADVSDFRRELNMKEGYLERSFTAKLASGNMVKVSARRFLSIDEDEICAIRYSVTPVNFDGELTFSPFLDGDVHNRDSNYNEQFWDIEETGSGSGGGWLMARTRKSGFLVCMHMTSVLETGGKAITATPAYGHEEKYVYNTYRCNLKKGEAAVLYKYVSVLSSFCHTDDRISVHAREKATAAREKGFDALFSAHVARWADNWSHSDIVIKGDPAAQQGIRFNIFQINQTYTGKDERLNIGPKGFTGEKYGGSTYWDTEAYMVPFYLSTAPQKVARNLLTYRYKHLEKAIENAEKLGFRNGAALYPMVTMNGEECHNEWEITFEEIHRNGAIAYAIFNYIRYTGDDQYLTEGGLEVLIAISRFWRQRVNWSDIKGKYVILGVTGPNEYENNVNNNWYTNKMASWTMGYTLEALTLVKERYPESHNRILSITGLTNKEEISWKEVIDQMYFPMMEQKGIFLQQDGYMDKEQILVSDLDASEKPINQHWSWDRILRSCFIKQADVLQGIYNFEDEYDTETIKKNFDFYEPRTVHESSLSPCIHSILASRIGMPEKAYELYLRTSRLDLDDYNHEVKEGLHITSMGGTWMSVVYGFGGLRVRNGMLHFDPRVPQRWDSVTFKIVFRENILRVMLNKNHVDIANEEGGAISLMIRGEKIELSEKGSWKS
ncbi:MAG: family 65 glycosyl hydrolase domain-containing protein [Bacteroidota bacterium]